jgi:hypothetical protein
LFYLKLEKYLLDLEIKVSCKHSFQENYSQIVNIPIVDIDKSRLPIWIILIQWNLYKKIILKKEIIWNKLESKIKRILHLLLLIDEFLISLLTLLFTLTTYRKKRNSSIMELIDSNCKDLLTTLCIYWCEVNRVIIVGYIE